MDYRLLGNTGLRVSAVGLGTAALGMSYAGGQAPTGKEAADVVAAALDAGVNYFDTAQTYGDAERLLGRTLRGRGVVATKVPVEIVMGGKAGSYRGIEGSLRALKRDAIDILQVHSAPVSIFSGEAGKEIGETLRTHVKAGSVRFLGATVYTVDEARAAAKCSWCDVVQIPISVLDQRMVGVLGDDETFRKAGWVGRSALVRGALAGGHAPEPLKRYVDRVRAARGPWTVPEFAHVYVRSLTHTVLSGARSVAELRAALVAGTQSLPAWTLADATALAVPPEDALALDPRSWS